MVADDIDALAAERGGAALHVFAGAIVARHVEGRRGELLHLVAEISGDGQRFRKTSGMMTALPTLSTTPPSSWAQTAAKVWKSR